MYNLKIGNKIEKEVPTEVYRLVLKFEHGDADETSQQVLSFKEDSIDLLNLYIKALMFFNASCRAEYGGTTQYEEVCEFMKHDTYVRRGKELSFADNLSWDYDKVYRDDEVKATLDDWIVTYFDHDGIEYSVDVEVQ